MEKDGAGMVSLVLTSHWKVDQGAIDRDSYGSARWLHTLQALSLYREVMHPNHINHSEHSTLNKKQISVEGGHSANLSGMVKDLLVALLISKTFQSH